MHTMTNEWMQTKNNQDADKGGYDKMIHMIWLWSKKVEDIKNAEFAGPCAQGVSDQISTQNYVIVLEPSTHRYMF